MAEIASLESTLQKAIRFLRFSFLFAQIALGQHSSFQVCNTLPRYPDMEPCLSTASTEEEHA